MKKNIIYSIFVLLFIVIIIYNYLNPNSFVTHMKSVYFPKEIKGKIYDFVSVKGGSISLSIHTESGDDGITIRNPNVVFNSSKKYTYFKKVSNTNKCYIIKGDSIMYFDCYVFSTEDSIKIGKIENGIQLLPIVGY